MKLFRAVLILIAFPGTSTLWAQHPSGWAEPAVYNSLKQELVRKPGILTDDQYTDLESIEKSGKIIYIDGMGRMFAEIGIRAGANGYDMIMLHDYDSAGRPDTLFLPYVSNGADGTLRRRNIMRNAQMNFYDNANDLIVDDDYPFALRKYDNSPISYVYESGAPGSAWQPGGHTSKRTYRFNKASEVRIWKEDLTSSAYYASGTLLIDSATDENGNKVKTIKDKWGRMLEKHVQAETNVWLKTLYVYSDRGLPKAIIQPEGVQLLGSGTSITSITDHHAFFLTYDSLSRIVEKKVPGASATYYGYDPLGRLTLMQDGNLRAQNKWLYIKYDRNNRPVIQGIYTNNTYTTRAAIQQNVLNVLSYASGETFYEKKQSGGVHGYTNQSFPTGDTLVLSVTYYDDYDTDANGSDDYAYTAQSLSVETPYGTYTEGTQFKTRGRATASKVRILGTNSWLKAYVFYDSDGNAIQVRSNNHLSLAVDNLVTSVYDFTGQLWLTKKYHNAGGSHQTTVINHYEYDHAGRIKRVFQKNNSDDSVQVVSYRYNTMGQVISKNLHCTDCPEEDPAVSGGISYADNIELDATLSSNTILVAGQSILLKPGFLISGGTTLTASIDEQDVESASSNRYLQSVDYRYNIRGWLTSINNAQLTDDGSINDDDNDLFGMELLYNNTESGLNSGTDEQFYNGNISAIKWKGPTTETGSLGQRSYKFNYDKADRLLQATYGVKTASNWTGEAGAQNESMTYDHNGNIKTLQRNKRKWEWTGALPEYADEEIDDLTYTFANDGNQLTKVEDAVAGATGNEGFKNGTTQTTEFTYTSDGSVTADKNKGIDNVVYNVLGKPDSVKFSDGRVLTYKYAASGAKLTMKAWQNTTLVTTTDYVDAFVYENDTLQFFGSPEGRVVNKDGELEYEYAIADHLGSTRVVFSSVTPEDDVVETDFESSSNSEFLNYGNRNGMSEMNHTVSGTYSQLLNGGNSSQVGAARTIHVYPGDTIKAEVYAKYRNVTGTSGNLLGFAAALTSAFGVSSGSTGEALNAYNSLNEFGGFIAGGDRPDDDASPKGFITIMLFDKDHNFLDAAWDQIDEAYEQTGVLDNDPFDFLTQQMAVTEEGYAYIFVSNENPTQADVHFDDLTITHSKTNVLQYNEYYPFGLQTSNSWTREGSNNDFLYNAGNELNASSGWYETFFRGYDATLGRFLQVDPMTMKYSSLTPYNYGFNDPVFWNDPLGLDPLSTWKEVADVIDDLLDSRHGGYWNVDTGSHEFRNLSEENSYAMAMYQRDFGSGGGGTIMPVYGNGHVERVFNSNSGTQSWDYFYVRDVVSYKFVPFEVYSFSQVGWAPLDYEKGRYSAQAMATYAMDFSVSIYQVNILDKEFKIIGSQWKVTISAVSFVSYKVGTNVIPSAKVSIGLPSGVPGGSSWDGYDSKVLKVGSPVYIRGGGQYTYVGEATFDLLGNSVYELRLEGNWMIEYDNSNRFIPVRSPYIGPLIGIDKVITIRK